MKKWQRYGGVMQGTGGDCPKTPKMIASNEHVTVFACNCGLIAIRMEDQDDENPHNVS